MLKQQILSILQKTPRITRAELVAQTHASDRAVRHAIHELRWHGYRICSDTQTGGYWIGTPEEWNAFCLAQRKAAVSRMYRKTDEMSGQIVVQFVTNEV